jgi:hypothetical protein
MSATPSQQTSLLRAWQEEPMQLARHTRLRRAIAYTALTALLGVVSLTLSQCTQVGDSLTGVGLNAGKPISCKAQCDQTRNLAQKAEDSLHKVNMQACGSNAACKSAENARHLAAQHAIDAARDACKANCHKQGAGSAG